MCSPYLLGIHTPSSAHFVIAVAPRRRIIPYLFQEKKS
jgi:hypothetical protein